MTQDDKPPLDEAALVHFGIRGMHWGKRKPQDRSSGSGRPGSDKYGYAARAHAPGTSNASRSSDDSRSEGPSKQKMSAGKKAAIGASVIAGAAAAAFILSRGGNVPVSSLGSALSNPQTSTAIRNVTSSPAFRTTLNDLDSVTANLISGTNRMLGS